MKIGGRRKGAVAKCEEGSFDCESLKARLSAPFGAQGGHDDSFGGG